MPKKDILQKIGTLKSNIRLTDAERARGLAEIQKFMAANPLQKEAWWMRLSRPFVYSMAAFLVVVMAGGGVSYAATNSLPGDALYGVKVNVVEEVEASFRFTAQAKANFQVVRAQRRLDEATELAAAGNLDDEKEAIVVAQLEKYTTSIEALIMDLDDAESIRDDWNAVFTANESIVLEIITSDEVQETPIEDSETLEDIPSIVIPVNQNGTKPPKDEVIKQEDLIPIDDNPMVDVQVQEPTTEQKGEDKKEEDKGEETTSIQSESEPIIDVSVGSLVDSGFILTTNEPQTDDKTVELNTIDINLTPDVNPVDSTTSTGNTTGEVQIMDIDLNLTTK